MPKSAKKRPAPTSPPHRNDPLPRFPVGDNIRAVVVDWVDYLRHEKLWGLDDPLFPATMVSVGDNLRFEAAGLDRKHWSNAGPIRKIFKEAFALAGLPYFNPHSFRKTWRCSVDNFAGHRSNIKRGLRLGLPLLDPRADYFIYLVHRT
jgi:integrase